MDDVYVVGGLIDRPVTKNHTLSYAERTGMRTARLPIRALLLPAAQPS